MAVVTTKTLTFKNIELSAKSLQHFQAKEVSTGGNGSALYLGDAENESTWEHRLFRGFPLLSSVHRDTFRDNCLILGHSNFLPHSPFPNHPII